MSSQHDTANRIRYTDPQDPWEMLETPWGRMEAWRASTLATGRMGVFEQVRADAIAAEAKRTDIEEREQAIAVREIAADARERSLAVTATRLRDAIGRADAQWDRIEQARTDQERELAEPLVEPPTSMSKLPEPALPTDDVHAPSGDLHAVGPVRDPAEDIEQDQAEFPDPELARPPEQQQPVAAGLDAGPIMERRRA